MALESYQPIGHLCDLLGISRCQPGVFDAIAELVLEGGEGDTGRDARIADMIGRMRH